MEQFVHGMKDNNMLAEIIRELTKAKQSTDITSEQVLYCDNSLLAETKQPQDIWRQAFTATILWPLHQVLKKMLN